MSSQTHQEKVQALKLQIAQAKELEDLEKHLAEIELRRLKVQASLIKEKAPTVSESAIETQQKVIKTVKPMKTTEPTAPVKISTKDARLRLQAGDLRGAEQMVEEGLMFTVGDIQALEKAIGTRRMLIHFTMRDGATKTLTYSTKSKSDIHGLFKSIYGTSTYNGEGSDAVEEVVAMGFNSIRFEEATKSVNNQAVTKRLLGKDGKFFRYINLTDLDLTRYQILTEGDEYEEVLKSHCLIHTLRLCGVDEAKLNSITLAYEEGTSFKTSNLKKVSEIIGKRIKLHKYTKRDKVDVRSIGVKTLPEHIDVALYEDHYFIYEETKYTEYTIKNYAETRDEPRFADITGKNARGYFVRGSAVKTRIPSLAMIKNLMDGGFFDGEHYLLNSFDEYHKKKITTLNIPLDNILQEQQLYEHTPKETKDTMIWFADLESIVAQPDGSPTPIHTGFKAGLSAYNFKAVHIFSGTPENPQAWLTDLFGKVSDIHKRKKHKESPIIYFHNVKYDFALLVKRLYVVSECEKDGQLYEVTIKYNGVQIRLRDSFKLINVALYKFPGIFGLPENLKKQEAIAYKYYTVDTMYKTKAKISTYRKYLSGKDRAIFDINVKQRNEDDSGFEFEYDSKNQTFNPSSYYDYYLRFDVMVLKEGMKVYEQRIRKLTDLNLFDHLTISSLTNYYMADNGAFDGLCEVKGNLREFLSKAVYGGRVGVLAEAVKMIINKEIADYDACSLYPSAIARMCRERGIPMGRAKVLQVFGSKQIIEAINNITYYVVRVNITKINKFQQNPFIANRTEDGLRYINEIPEGGIQVIIDQVTLEDYIEFHDIEYEILGGVYWDSGVNRKMGQIIEDLYAERVIEKQLLKKANNAGNKDEAKSHDTMQQIIKLMLNSAYGKTIIKKTVKKSSIMEKGQEFTNYVCNHFNTIEKYEELNDKQYKITSYGYDDSYNLSQVGIMCLSYSKRIMNEVMGTANDNGIKIYYQDTDSMHMELKDVPRLEKAFKNKYHRELKGEDMGNFHIDFSLDGALKGEQIKSIKSIFLGKKCYIDELTTPSGAHGYHYRMKGVTQSGMDHAIKKYGGVMQLYEHLAQGNAVDMVLNPEGGRDMFEHVCGQVRTRKTGDFIRQIKF